MAVPKKKTSKARRDKRRSNVWKLTAPTTGETLLIAASSILQPPCMRQLPILPTVKEIIQKEEA